MVLVVKSHFSFSFLVCELHRDYVKEYGSIQKAGRICSFSFDGNTVSIQSNYWAWLIGVVIKFVIDCLLSNYLCIINFYLFSFINKSEEGWGILRREFLSLLFMAPLLSTPQSLILAQAVSSRMHLLIRAQAVFSRMLLIRTQVIFSTIHLLILDIIPQLAQPQAHLQAPYTIIRYANHSVEITSLSSIIIRCPATTIIFILVK